MSNASGLTRFAELFRFYQAAIVNTLFGYGLYALLVTTGINIFAAQAISYVSGTLFNYFTYSRHAFPGEKSPQAKAKFVVSYTLNYFVNFGALWFFHLFIKNQYYVGAATAAFCSAVNYFLLKYFVFSKRKPA